MNCDVQLNKSFMDRAVGLFVSSRIPTTAGSASRTAVRESKRNNNGSRRAGVTNLVRSTAVKHFKKCTICSKRLFQGGSHTLPRVTTLNCEHQFHLKCIRSISLRNGIYCCPICRTSEVQGNVAYKSGKSGTTSVPLLSSSGQDVGVCAIGYHDTTEPVEIVHRNNIYPGEFRRTRCPEPQDIQANSISVVGCGICTEELTPTTTRGLPNCCHQFHKVCLKKWEQRSKTCPACRLPSNRTLPSNFH